MMSRLRAPPLQSCSNAPQRYVLRYSASARSVSESRIATIRSVVNPDKLAHLGPVESLRDVMDAVRAETGR